MTEPRVLVSLNPHVIALAAAESLRMIHLFRFRGRHDEIPRSGRARHVRVFVHAFPQQRSEGFGALVAQVLMLEPLGSPPPPAITIRAAADLSDASLFFIARNAARRR